jgi:hypothetical protein
MDIEAGAPVRLISRCAVLRTGRSLPGTTITLTDVTRSTRLEEELQTSHPELETMNEELHRRTKSSRR